MKWFRNLFRREPAKPTKWLSWYKTPVDEQLFWLCKYADGNGYWYSPWKENAHRFDTFEEAIKPTPGYDGSANVSSRTGVIAE